MARFFVIGVYLIASVSLVLFSKTPVIAATVELSAERLAVVHVNESPQQQLSSAGILSLDGRNWLATNTHVVLIGDIIPSESAISRNLKQVVAIAELAADQGSALTVLKSARMVDFEFYMSPEQQTMVNQYPEVVRWNQHLITNGGISLKAAKTNLLPGSGTNDWPVAIHSPMNYMGNQICHPLFETSRLRDSLALLGASTLWIARSDRVPEEHWQSRLANQVQILGEGTVAYLDKGGEVLVRHQQQEVSAVQAPDRYPANPVGMSTEEIVSILKNGNVVNSQEIPVGITKPVRLTLSYQGKELDAIFKTLDNHPDQERGNWKQSRNIMDRYGYEIATYQLDQMLGIGLVPVVIERDIDGKKGALQVWYDGLISKLGYLDKGMTYNGHCDRRAQRVMMHTFDFLIRNEDRNQSNILHNQSDWQVWFIDHSRAYGLKTNRHSTQEKSKFYVTEEFKQRLESIDRDQLYELRPWLHKRQIRSIDKRRRNLIAGNF
jgi:hypothetical protein